MGERGRGVGICVERGLALAGEDFIPSQGILNQRFYLYILHREALLGARAYLQVVWSINQLGGREASSSFLYSIPFQHIATKRGASSPMRPSWLVGSDSLTIFPFANLTQPRQLYGLFQELGGVLVIISTMYGGALCYHVKRKESSLRASSLAPKI